MIVYDEVHLLPAPVFRITAEIQAKRRLGLTATLVREDGREDDVFSLIGPKKADVPWKELEKQGWIATAICTEIRIPLEEENRLEYAIAEPREKFRLASVNPRKEDMIEALLQRHPDDQCAHHRAVSGTTAKHRGSVSSARSSRAKPRSASAKKSMRRSSSGENQGADRVQSRQLLH